MCGITGWFSQLPITVEEKNMLNPMIDKLAHRGPDGRGSFFTQHAALGHTRLAVIDLSSGDQPLHSIDGLVSIIFNGEIYNYQSIRQDLTKQGFQFKTHSDTEVILNLYLRDGWKGFNLLRGMFAIVIWDQRTQTGYLCRDSIGIKPLFLQYTKNNLIFGSEAKSIIARNSQKPSLDENNLHLLLNFRYLPGNRSLFRNIVQLEPGKVLQWKNGISKKFELSPTVHCQDNVLKCMEDSVRIHLTSDVEVGLYLSGGMDSAVITALAVKAGYTKLNTFTLEAGDNPNEAKYAKLTAKYFKVNNICEPIANDLAGLFTKLIWHLEVPKINSLQSSLVAKLAAQHVKVVLSGLGGDELFYGYNIHRIIYYLNLATCLSPRKLLTVLGKLGNSLPTNTYWSETGRLMTALQHTDQWHIVYGLIRNLWDRSIDRRELYGPRLLDHPLEDTFDILEKYWPKVNDPLLATTQYEFQQKMVNDLLWQEDRMSMAQGLEVRVPFLDLAMTNRIQQIKRDVLMPHGKAKGYLKNTVSAILPESILKRPKSGFQVSSPEFFHSHLIHIANDVLSKEKVIRYGLFNYNFIKNTMNLPIKKQYRWHYFQLYLMLMTHLWVDIFEQEQWSP